MRDRVAGNCVEVQANNCEAYLLLKKMVGEDSRWGRLMKDLIGHLEDGSKLKRWSWEREVIEVPPDDGSSFVKKIPGRGVKIEIELDAPIKEG